MRYALYIIQKDYRMGAALGVEINPRRSAIGKSIITVSDNVYKRIMKHVNSLGFEYWGIGARDRHGILRIVTAEGYDVDEMAEGHAKHMEAIRLHAIQREEERKQRRRAVR